MGAGEQTNNREEETARNCLWRFAVDAYGAPGVAEACLSAQQRWDVDVILMLYASWCAAQGVPLAPADLHRAEERCRIWRESVVLPVRKRRIQWSDAPELRAEYTAIKGLELQAERSQLELLADLFALDHGSAAVAEAGTSAQSGLLGEQLKVLAEHYGLEGDAFADFDAALQKA